MKKVVILYPTHWQQAMGGAELQIKYLVEKLIAKNFKVYFIYEDIGVPFENNNPLELVPLKSKLKSKRLGDRWVVFKNDIFKNLNIIEPDAIYTRGYSSWSGFATHYANNNNINHVYAIASNNSLIRLDQKVSIFKPLDIVAVKLIKYAIQNCTHVLVQNKDQAANLLNLHDRKGSLITQASKTVTNEKTLNKSSIKLEIVWIANLKPIKRPEFYIEIVKNFKDNPNITFTMIGRYSKKYKSNIEEVENFSNFEYLGEVSNDIVNQYLGKSHILINTSIDEGFSNTFVQAWLRKVVVISMNSNPDEILTEKNIGFLCGTIKDIRDKIDYLRSNRSLLKQLGEDSYQYAMIHHDIDKNLEKVISLLMNKPNEN